MQHFCRLLLLSASGACASSTLDVSLQLIIDGATRLTGGTAFSLGVAVDGRTISLSSGKRQAENSASKVLPTDAFAMGSTQKMYTAAAILRLVDAGKIGLDDKALPLFDTLWTKLNGTSIVNLLGPQIKDVTVRHLLQMQSGIPDFDNMASRGYQFDHPTEDLGPIKELNFLSAGKRFDCDPGTCGSYSSSNFELLGLILAQQAGAQSWDDYKQAEGLPSDVLGNLPSTAFAVHGPCSKYTHMHAYSKERTPPVDVFTMSCTNGWTCGNLISNAADAAVFVRALLGKGEHVLKARTQQEMVSFKSLTQGWSTGLLYGLGTMDMSKMIGTASGEFIGHGGETYGFSSSTGYSRKYDFGASVVANSESTFAVSEIMSRVYKTVAHHLSANATVVV